jgi:hypothetical protein
MTDATMVRWEMFLGKIRDRLLQIVEESRVGCADLLQQSDHDPAAMSNAWGAMKMRAQALTKTIDDTWSEQVEPKFDDGTLADRGQQMGSALKNWIEVELERAEVQIHADAARQVWDRAKAEQLTQISCIACAGEVPVPEVLQAVNLSCSYCSAINTYEPGGRLRIIEHFCAHALSKEESWAAWLRMLDADRMLSRSRNTTLALLQAYETAQIGYWRAYLEARARILPHRAADLEKDLRGKMQHWYMMVVYHEKEWVAAGRPQQIS